MEINKNKHLNALKKKTLESEIAKQREKQTKNEVMKRDD